MAATSTAAAPAGTSAPVAMQTAAAPARCVLDSTSLVCSEAILEAVAPFSIRIGPHTVVHPTATILAVGGDIVIGAHNVIEEQCVIVNPAPLPGSADEKSAAASGKGVPMRIGDHNVFEVGSRVSCRAVGSGNVFGAKSVVSRAYTVADACSIGPRVVLGDDDAPHSKAAAAAAADPTAAAAAAAGAGAGSTAPTPVLNATIDATTKSAAAADTKQPTADDSVIASGTVIFGAAQERRHRDVPQSRIRDEGVARTTALRAVVEQMHRFFVNA